MSEPENDRFAKKDSASHPAVPAEILLDDPIIDLSNPELTWTRVERDLNPFERLSELGRRRLMVQVLCELVAFDAPEDEDDKQSVNAGSVPQEPTPPPPS